MTAFHGFMLRRMYFALAYSYMNNRDVILYLLECAYEYVTGDKITIILHIFQARRNSARKGYNIH